MLGRATALALRGPARGRSRGLPRRRRRRCAEAPRGRADRLPEPARARPVGRRGRRRRGGRPAGVPARRAARPARTRCGSCASTRPGPRASPGIRARCRRTRSARATTRAPSPTSASSGSGASAISVPVTNDAGLLQVSPFDSLTSLTRAPPGQRRPRRPGALLPDRATDLPAPDAERPARGGAAHRPPGAPWARRAWRSWPARASTRRSWSASWPSGCAGPGTRCVADRHPDGRPRPRRARGGADRGGAARRDRLRRPWRPPGRAPARRARDGAPPRRRCSWGAACSTARRCASARRRRGCEAYSSLRPAASYGRWGAARARRPCDASPGRRRRGPRRSTATRRRGSCSTPWREGGAGARPWCGPALRPRSRRSAVGPYEISRSRRRDRARRWRSTASRTALFRAPCRAPG